MDDLKICELGVKVLGGITEDLNKSFYEKLKGSLTIGWSNDSKFYAYASSYGAIDQPPEHCITICYALVIQIWRDAENFCSFINTIPPGSGVDKLYDFYVESEKLPSCFTKEEQIGNLFVGALTWVYFHEIGHLMQEHGYIRSAKSILSDDEKLIGVHEFYASEEKSITGETAIVFHTTELAADFEATNFYITELIRHIKNPNFFSERKKGDIFSGLLYLMICGLSIVFLRFNGALPRARPSVPCGLHPDPFIRLELNIPHIVERLSNSKLKELVGYDIDRTQLVFLSNKAALSVALYWSMTKTVSKEFDSEFIIRGLASKKETLQYFSHIVKCWDEILPEITKIRRFGNNLGLLTFTKEFRERINLIIPWGEGGEKIS